MNVCIVVPSLKLGGTEKFVIRLLKDICLECNVFLVTLFGGGILSESIRDLNCQKITLFSSTREVVNPFSLTRVVFRVRRKLKALDIQIIQTFLYPADLFSLLLASKKRTILWSIRGTDTPEEKRFTRIFLRRFSVFLMRFVPFLVVACSEAAACWGERNRVARRRITVVNNSIEAWTWNTKSQSRLLHQDDVKQLRIGMAARLENGKGQDRVIRAIEMLTKKEDLEIVLDLIGKNTELLMQDYPSAQKSSSKGYFSVIGRGMIVEENALSSWFASVDLFIMASNGLEGFPNSLAEAVFIGIPSLTTDAGNSRDFIGEDFWIDQSPNSISDGVLRVQRMSASRIKSGSEENRNKLISLIGMGNAHENFLTIWKDSVRRER